MNLSCDPIRELYEHVQEKLADVVSIRGDPDCLGRGCRCVGAVVRLGQKGVGRLEVSGRGSEPDRAGCEMVVERVDVVEELGGALIFVRAPAIAGVVVPGTAVTARRAGSIRP